MKIAQICTVPVRRKVLLHSRGGGLQASPPNVSRLLFFFACARTAGEIETRRLLLVKMPRIVCTFFTRSLEQDGSTEMVTYGLVFGHQNKRSDVFGRVIPSRRWERMPEMNVL